MVKLNEMSKGSIIKFAGSNWILLDPVNGYIISQSIYSGRPFHSTSANGKFTPDQPNNIGYYLNVTYYNSIPEVDKKVINARVWKTGYNDMEDLSQVTANIGLISYSEWDRYSSTIGRPTETFWTLTRSHGEFGRIDSVWIVNDEDGGYLSTPINFYEVSHGVRPTLTLKPTVDVIDGVVVGNVAPTQPGAFTQPSGTLEIGDSKIFSVGASSDENGNLAKYVWEASINGAVYSKAGETTTPSFTYAIPTATSLKMRVKAVDSEGLESAYRESSQYTVTKPKYYWSKYTANAIKIYVDTAEYVLHPPNGYRQRFAGLVKTITYDNKTNKYIPTSYWPTEYTTVQKGDIAYFINSDKVQKNVAISTNDVIYDVDCDVYTKDLSTNSYTTNYEQGSLVQSGIIAEEGTYPTNGRHSDTYWYVRGSRVNQSIAPPAPFTSPTTGKKFKPNEVANITFGSSIAPNLSLYEVDYRYNVTGTWTQLPYSNTLTRSLAITTDKAHKMLELRVRAKNTSNVYSDYVYSEPFIIEHNVAPTVSLTGPSENATLYETDTLNIAGTAHDADADQAVTVYYQINGEPKKVLATNLSQMQIPLSKTLTFKGGKLYDGETVITGSLAEGVAHKLKVWAEDSEKASSAIVEKSFYVVPNRAPLLSVDAVVPSGVVDADKFKISGTASDQDANSSVKVTRRINAGNAVEIYSGQGGAWEFDVSLAQLQVGENTIVVEVIDNYGAKTSKTIKLNKNEVKTPILHSVARYKITPPAGSAKGVLLFIERDEVMDLKVELSMTLAGEQEQYETLTPNSTAPMPNAVGIVEDTYFHESTEAKDNIILKLSTTRPDATVNHKIHLISGAVE